MSSRHTTSVRSICVAFTGLAALACSSHVGDSERVTHARQLVSVSKPTLELQELTNSCGLNQVQQFFQVINNGTSPVKVSDIQIKYWINDQSSGPIEAAIYNPGCVLNATDPSCAHPVPSPAATISASKLASACGPDANHQANWEVTVSSTDSYSIPPGGRWNNIQTALHLSNYANFDPGTSTWFSGCLAGSSYANDKHFAVYYQGNLVYSSGLNPPSCRAPRGTQILTGHSPSELSTMPLVGRVPPATELEIEVGLPARDRAALEAFVRQVSDPSQAQFRQYRTLAQFQADHSPTVAQYQQLITWAQANDLTVHNEFPSRLLLTLRGTAEAIERALFLQLNYHLRPDGTQFYAPDREPSLNLDVPVLRISGLDNYVVPKPASLDPNGTGPASNYLAKDLRNAYAKCTSLTGTGQRVGIFLNATGTTLVDYLGYDATELSNDVNAYLGLSGVSSSTTITACNIGDGNGGCSTQLPTTNVPRTGDTVYSELALDVEMALAMAPGLDEIVIFEGGGPVAALQVLATRTPVINQFSISYDLNILHDANGAQALELLAYKGQSVFVSSGDAGPAQKDNSFATNKSLTLPYTIVGGTELQLDSSQTGYKTETTWWNPAESTSKPGTTGGVILYQALPSYQADLATPENGSSNKRNFPDVSLIARKVVTVAGANSPTDLTGHVWSSGGTSAAAPLWASFVALANQANAASSLGTVGFANPLIYAIAKSSKYSTYFHDIADGSSTGSSNNYAVLSASTGYDLATGWGTPKCDLINRLNKTYQSSTSAKVTYKQYGACTFVPTPLGNATPGPYAAYAAFEVSSISNTTTQTLHFDPTRLYVQQGTTRSYVDPVLAIFSQIFGPFAIDSATFAPGDSVNYSPAADLAVVVSTSTSDGANEANKTAYELGYDSPAGEPDVIMVKSNPSQTSWPYTPNCCDIGPAVCL